MLYAQSRLEEGTLVCYSSTIYKFHVVINNVSQIRCFSSAACYLFSQTNIIFSNATGCVIFFGIVDMAQLIYQSAIFVDYLTFAILSLECHDEII